MKRFACREYKQIELSDCKDWNEWQNLINEDYKYCKSISYIFEFEEKCKDWELPSYHPYWSYVCRKDLFELIEQTKGLIAQTQKYIDRGGYYWVNAEGSIRLQKESIKDYLRKINV